MKKLGLTLSFSLLLVACNNQDSISNTARTVPDVEAALPAVQDLPMDSLKAKTRLTTLALPAWRGPRTVGDFLEWRTSIPQAGVNNKGDLYLGNVFGGTGGRWTGQIRGYNSTGTYLGSGQTIAKGFSGMAVSPDPSASSGRVSVWSIGAGYSNDSTRQVATSFQPWEPTGQENRQGTQADLQVLNGIHRDSSGFYDLEPTKYGFAFLDSTPVSRRFVNVYEGSAPEVASYGLINQITPVQFPQNLTGFDADRVQMDFSVGAYGLSYVVMAFPATGCTDVACLSLINVQQVKDGRVQWSRVWKTSQPAKLQYISANKNDVAILMNVGAANPDTIAAQSQITWVRADGVVSLRARVPLELWRRDWTTGTPEQQYAVIPNLKFIQTDDNGKLVLNNGNVIFSGTFAEGFSNIYLVNHEASPTVNRGSIAGPVVFNGDYVYGAGSTRTNFGQPSSNQNNDKFFILPLDFQLNER